MTPLTLAASGFALVIGVGCVLVAAYDELEARAPYWVLKALGVDE